MSETGTIFETERLIARRWSNDHLEAAFQIYSDPDVARHIGNRPMRDLDQMRSELNRLTERNKRFEPGGDKTLFYPLGSFPVFERSTDDLVGSALLKPLPDTAGELTDEIEVGWHLGKRHWGKGYATEFGHKLLEIGFAIGECAEIFAVTDIPNVKSQAVALRLGMTHTGQTTKYYSGEPLEFFVITQQEWKSKLGNAEQ